MTEFLTDKVQSFLNNKREEVEDDDEAYEYTEDEEDDEEETSDSYDIYEDIGGFEHGEHRNV
jgi:hypothetical protein